ncbi:MAG: GEVED domain-containing protein [Chitinophagales bacterium]|nr:GEVED domain-containing protein [Chitinophagales bacterium]
MGQIFTLFIILLFSFFNTANAQYLINENFDASATTPAGWTFSGATVQTNNPRSTPNSVAFAAKNQTITTPLLSNPDTLRFYYRRSSTAPTIPKFTIQVATSISGPWTTIGTITAFTTTYQTFIYDLSSYSNIYVRILDERASGANQLYVDDFSITELSSTPTIYTSRTGVSGYQYNEGNGPSLSDTFTISGINLSANITLNAVGNYEISTNLAGPYASSINLTPTSGTVASTIIYTRLKSGLTEGAYTENITASSTGATNKTVAHSGFVTPGSCNGLLISEYIYGTANNKYIEIYNPTSSNITLRTGSTHYYRLAIFANGSTTATNILFPDNAFVPAYGSYVIGHPSGTIYTADATSGSINFTGNDAISLQKSYSGSFANIDVIGEIGIDPGANWSLGGLTTGQGVLVRKPEIKTGKFSEVGFPTLGTEWIAYGINDKHNLGNHINECKTANNTLTTTLSTNKICAGQSLSIDFTSKGIYSGGNVFTAQLSDSSGSFATYTTVGTLPKSGTNPSGTINIAIPLITLPSTNYHIRVISSMPNSGANISLNHLEIMSSIPINVTAYSGTNGNGNATLNWTNPSSSASCWDEVMVVLTTTPGLTYNPTGNGSLYTANNTYSGSGNQVVYKGTGNNITINSLVNGTTYYFEIYTRYQNNWSSGLEYAIIPDIYCQPIYTATCDEYISRVKLESIDNYTSPDCGLRGYSWFANQSTDLTIGNSYTIQVQAGIVGDTDDISYTNDDITIWIDWNGNNSFENTERIINVLNNGGAGSYSFTVPNSATIGTTRMRVQLKYNGASNDNSCRTTFDYGETEDYSIQIKDLCTPTISNFTFFPISGSENTEVRINSTTSPSNFNLTTDVKFNDISATSFYLADSNTIYAIVPNGADTGRITLMEGTTCKKVSSGAYSIFNYQKQDGACGTTYTELFISEVQDPMSGNNHYIEIYNGSNSIINLDLPDNYTLQVVNLPPNTISNIDIQGSILPGQTLVYFAGTNGGLATGTQSGPGVGFNADDQIRLLKKGTVIDLFIAPSSTQYNYRRKPDAVAPKSTFDINDWTSHFPSSTADIGTFVPDNNLKITTQPLPQNGCEINMSVTAVGSGTLTYQWYYNNNNDPIAAQARAWTALSNGSTQFTDATISGATSNNLQITGDLGQLTGYQFYCIVTNNGTCNEYSHAAKFIAIPEPYFRSKQSGEWRSASTWEMSPTGLVGTWHDACTFPWDTNSVSVVIRSGDTVNISGVIANLPDVRIDQLMIENLGMLQIESSAELEINHTSGADIIVEGTLYDQSVSGKGLTFLSTAKWKLGNDGTIIKTQTSSVNNYKDNYDGGISTIPSTAHWIFRKETGNNPVVTTLGMFYPNLYFENDNATAANYIFSGNSGFATVKGNMTLRGINPVYVTDTNTYSTPMRVLGNLVIDSLNTFRIQAIENIGTGLEVAGDITVNGTLDLNHLSIGLLRLNGSGTQTISGSGTIDLWNVHLNKPSQILAVLDRDIEVKNQLQLSGGIIHAKTNTLNVSNGDPTNAIIGFDTPNNTGTYSDDRYIIGKLRRKIDQPASVYTFPIGDTARINPMDTTQYGYNPSRLTIRGLPGGVPFAIGEFVPAWPGPINAHRDIICGGFPKFIEYRALTGKGYWHFEGSNFNNYDINIHPNVLNINTEPNEDSPLGFSDTYRALKERTSQAGLVWDPDVSTAGNPCIVSPTYYDIIGAGYSGFSIFAPGGGFGLTTALPIELLYFNINCATAPTIKWATASELNTHYFTIEKSSDGIVFSPVAQIEAAGNSNQKLEYQFTINENDLEKYYRLVETDLDGSIYYHGIIENDCKKLYPTNIQVYYQPSKGIIAQFHPDKMPKIIQVFDASARLMVQQNVISESNIQSIIPATNWAKGIYLVNFIFDHESTAKKVVVY